MTSSTYLTVQALTKYIKRKFDVDPHLRDVYVMGELSNVKNHPNGHVYFTLKDDKARINAAMFKSNASKLAFTPESGMKVFIRGEVNVYETTGVYQLYANTMEPDGIGGLFVAFNQLKEKLQQEGLFNPNFKQLIPMFPKVIGVLTAKSGAAIQDICTTLERRYPMAKVVVFPTLVQGKNAAPNIVRNIQLANELNECDVLIVGRGGGSIEDLWAFNEEIVARAIFESRIPIISAVGHETDTTIADFAADLRAPTPTAAAELAVPNQQNLYQQVLRNQSTINQLLNTRLQNERQRLAKLQQAYPLATPERLYRPFIERLALATMQLEKANEQFFEKQSSRLEQLQSRLLARSPKMSLAFYESHLQQLEQRLSQATFNNIEQQKAKFAMNIRTLQALNPLNIMAKGFAVTYSDDHVVKRANDLQVGQEITVKYEDGSVTATVQSINLNNGEV